MKANKVLSFLLLLALLCRTMILAIPLYTSAATNGDYEYSVSNGKATITKYTGNDQTVIVPATLGGFSVEVIGDYAFRSCEATTIILPNSLRVIGEWAFNGCDMETIVIPYGVTEIGDSAFYACRSLTNINIPDSMMSIGGSAFHYCDSLQSISIPKNVTTIGYTAFAVSDCKLKIYCEAESKPSGWNAKWVGANVDATVIWAACMHREQETVVVDPTCKDNGHTTVTCLACNETLSHETTAQALGHDIIKVAAQSPTCLENGWGAYEMCTRCEYTTYSEKPALGHTQQTILIAPTCEENGYTKPYVQPAAKYSHIRSYLPQGI